MQGFKSAGHAQRFLAGYGPVAQYFRPRHHRLTAPKYCREMAQRSKIWREITGTTIAVKDRLGDCPPTRMPGNAIGTNELIMPFAGVIHSDDVKNLFCDVNPEHANLCHGTRILCE